MAKGKRKRSKVDDGYSEESKQAWKRAAAQAQATEKWEPRIQLGCFAICVAIALFIVVGLVREDAKPDTPQEKLEKQLEQGQRDVCRKWGSTVEGC